MILKLLLGLGLGGAAGFACYRLVGCPSGACPLTRNPWISTLCGMFLGGLIATSLQ